MFKDSILCAQSVQHGMKFGTAISWQGGVYHQGDIVLLKNPVAAGVMEIAVNSGDQFRLHMTPLRLVRPAGHSSSIWCRSDVGGLGEVHEMAHARHLRFATAWFDNSDHTITVVE